MVIDRNASKYRNKILSIEKAAPKSWSEYTTFDEVEVKSEN